MYQMCHDNKFDIDTRCINSQKTLDSIVNSSYAIINRAKYILPKYAPKAAKAYFNKMHTVLGKDGLLPVNSGTAVMLPKGYMVSCKHVFKEKLKPLTFNYGPAKIYFAFPLSQHYFVRINGDEYPITVVKRAKNIDAILLKVKLPLNLNPKPIKKSNLSGLKPGALIYLAGNTKTNGIQLKKGIVSKKDALMKLFINLNKEGAKRIKGIFGADIFSTLGDSGCPAYLIRDGKPELAGLVRSINHKYGNMVDILRIDYIDRALNLTKKGILEP